MWTSAEQLHWLGISGAKKRYQKFAPRAIVLWCNSTAVLPHMEHFNCVYQSETSSRTAYPEEHNLQSEACFPPPFRCCNLSNLFAGGTLALPGSSATSCPLRHAPRSGRCHGRPWISQGFWGTSPPRSTDRGAQPSGLDRLSLSFCGVLWRPARAPRPVHPRGCFCHLHRYVRRHRKSSLS
jgi:hypothetical protein